MNGYLLVRAGAMNCGLPADAVRHVFDVTTVHAAPAVLPSFLGVVPLGRAMVPLIHLEMALTGHATGAHCTTAVVVEVRGSLFALGVDDAEAVLRAPTEPRPPGWSIQWVGAVARHGDQLIPIVSVEDVADRLSMTSGSSAR